MNLGGAPLDGDVDLDKLSSRLEGYSGADIAYACRKVAEETFLDSVERKIDRSIGAADFDRVLQKLKPSVSRVDLDRFKKFKAGSS
jgi:SpoVK/Ycf46/Vps4 family AAA+-type ATPase